MNVNFLFVRGVRGDNRGFDMFAHDVFVHMSRRTTSACLTRPMSLLLCCSRQYSLQIVHCAPVCWSFKCKRERQKSRSITVAPAIATEKIAVNVATGVMSSECRCTIHRSVKLYLVGQITCDGRQAISMVSARLLNKTDCQGNPGESAKLLSLF